MRKKTYIINVSFKNEGDFLDSFIALYNNGFKMYMRSGRYEHAIELQGVCFNSVIVKRALQLLKPLNKKLIKLKIDTTETEIKMGEEIYEGYFKW